MLIPQDTKLSKILGGFAPLAAAAFSLAAALLILVATCIVWIAASVLVALAIASLFPHAGTAAFAIPFGLLFLPMGLGAVWLMLHCWPWYDTIVVVLWVGFQSYGSEGHPWPSFVVGMTALLVVSAALRWVQYIHERRLRARSNIPA